MRRKLILVVVLSLVSLIFLSGCFIVRPIAKVTELINNFKRYWELESSLGLSGIYTEPAHVGAMTYNRSQIEGLYGLLFFAKDVTSFNFLSDRDISFNSDLTAADVTFLARANYADGTSYEHYYEWEVIKVGSKWYINYSNGL